MLFIDVHVLPLLIPLFEVFLMCFWQSCSRWIYDCLIFGFFAGGEDVANVHNLFESTPALWMKNNLEILWKGCLSQRYPSRMLPKSITALRVPLPFEWRIIWRSHGRGVLVKGNPSQFASVISLRSLKDCHRKGFLDAHLFLKKYNPLLVVV